MMLLHMLSHDPLLSHPYFKSQEELIPALVHALRTAMARGTDTVSQLLEQVQDGWAARGPVQLSEGADPESCSSSAAQSVWGTHEHSTKAKDEMGGCKASGTSSKEAEEYEAEGQLSVQSGVALVLARLVQDEDDVVRLIAAGGVPALLGMLTAGTSLAREVRKAAIDALGRDSVRMRDSNSDDAGFSGDSDVSHAKAGRMVREGGSFSGDEDFCGDDEVSQAKAGSDRCGTSMDGDAEGSVGRDGSCTPQFAPGTPDACRDGATLMVEGCSCADGGRGGVAHCSSHPLGVGGGMEREEGREEGSWRSRNGNSQSEHRTHDSSLSYSVSGGPTCESHSRARSGQDVSVGPCAPRTPEVGAADGEHGDEKPVEGMDSTSAPQATGRTPCAPSTPATSCAESEAPVGTGNGSSGGLKWISKPKGAGVLRLGAPRKANPGKSNPAASLERFLLGTPGAGPGKTTPAGSLTHLWHASRDTGVRHACLAIAALAQQEMCLSAVLREGVVPLLADVLAYTWYTGAEVEACLLMLVLAHSEGGAERMCLEDEGRAAHALMGLVCGGCAR